jgi:crotonobetainyl-CoA:carnitine CoA-transferase CaiB-like acyl-CoA transferase
MLLGDMGAEVIKVESPKGDDTRHWGPPWLGDESAYYLAVNRNKRSLTLNLKSPEGQQIAKTLARQSQIVIENFKPGQMAQFGLDYETLKRDHPALVYASITGYGQSGPYADRPGYDQVIQAMSGLMSITGSADGEPYKVGVAVTDVLTGMFALSGILAALRHAEITGHGQVLDFALFDSQLAGLVNVASNALISGAIPRRYGSAHPNIVPYQPFRAMDGELVVSVGNDSQFAALCDLIAQPELKADPRYQTNPARVAHRESLIPVLQAAFETQTVATWVNALNERGIPSGPINNVIEALDDPHVQARQIVRETELHNGHTLRYVASPLQDAGEIRYPPPALGQHTESILTEWLGYGPEQIADYRARGVI